MRCDAKDQDLIGFEKVTGILVSFMPKPQQDIRRITLKVYLMSIGIGKKMKPRLEKWWWIVTASFSLQTGRITLMNF